MNNDLSTVEKEKLVGGLRFVLLVDDSPLWVNMLKTALANKGFIVEALSDGLAAIEYLKEKRPDIILLDYFLPKVTGARVAKFARKLPHLDNAKILILSGAADDIFPADAETADAVIAKESIDRVLENILTVLEDLEDPAKRLKYVFNIVKSKDLAKRSITRKIHQYKKRLEGLYEALGEVILEVDDKKRIIDFNSKAIEVLGLSGEEIVGKDIESALSLPPGSAFGNELALVMSGEKKTAKNIEISLNKSFYEVSMSRISTEGADYYMLMALNNINDRKMIEEFQINAKVKERHQELEEKTIQERKFEAVGRLLSGVVHDFNNLMATIMLYSDMAIGDVNGNEPVRKKLEQVKKAAEYSVALSRRLLAFSHREVVQAEIVNVNDIFIGDMRKMLSRLIGENIFIETALEPGLKAVKIDRGQLELIIINLIINARDAMPEGGQITIRTENVSVANTDAGKKSTYFGELKEGAWVAFSIEDMGVGMSKETLSKVFEPNFTTKDKGKGSGIGLKLISDIVRQNKGDISLASEPGVGSTFTIYFPVCEEANHAANGISKQRVSPSINGETILVVEDDNILRSALVEFLKKLGYNVLEASGGTRAIRISRDYGNEIHLLITDIIMPFMDGFEVAAALKEKRPKMDVIFTSGYMENESIKHKVFGFKEPFLQKPFSTSTLEDAIAKALKKGNSAG
ncbi:MAG: response regulator [Phycisphaerae bacterium]|nr:response regulator [Phycisphaerae bacterium]